MQPYDDIVIEKSRKFWLVNPLPTKLMERVKGRNCILVVLQNFIRLSPKKDLESSERYN